MVERLDPEAVEKGIAGDYKNFDMNLDFNSFVGKFCLSSYNLAVLAAFASDHFSFNLDTPCAPFAAFGCNG